MAGTLSTKRRAVLTPGMYASGVEARLTSLATSQDPESQAHGSVSARGDGSGDALQTRGEIEAAVSDTISRFQQDYIGRGPKSIRTHLIGDLIVVRLQGVLTAAEQHLVKPRTADKGRELLKQVRTQLIESARPTMELMVHAITGIKMLSLHHDISTVTGEEVLLFTLSEAPVYRQPR